MHQNSLMRKGLLIAVAAGAAVALLLLLLGPRPITLSTDRTGDPELAERLESLAGAGQHELSAVVIDGDTTTFAGLGSDEHTEFEVGSVVKIFTAELMAQLVEEGTVTEHTTVADILPEGAGTGVHDITLRELADHTSGLPRIGGTSTVRDIWIAVRGGNPYAGISREDVIQVALESSPDGRGEEAYSNLGVALLGHLLADAADTDYAQLLTSRILEPLGMEETYLMTPGSVPASAPRGLTSVGRQAEPWEMEGYLPAGGLRSTASDMALFTRHLLEKGLPDYTWAPLDSGLRWHNGSTFGYSAMLVVGPEGQASFVAGDTSTGVEEIGLALLGEEMS